MAPTCNDCNALTLRLSQLENLVFAMMDSRQNGSGPSMAGTTNTAAAVAASPQLAAPAPAMLAPHHPSSPPPPSSSRDNEAAWTLVNIRGRQPQSPTAPEPLLLSNSYGALSVEDFPVLLPCSPDLSRALPAQRDISLGESSSYASTVSRPPLSAPVSPALASHAPALPVSPALASHAPAQPVSPALASHAAAEPLQFPRESQPPSHPPSLRPRIPPARLVIGDSMVRHVRGRGSWTECIPGANVRTITEIIPHILADMPSVSTIIVHVGIVDVLDGGRFEDLKEDVNALINTLTATGKRYVISGPIASPQFGNLKFSRVWRFHLWLKALCSTNNVPFVDNLLLFFKRKYLFAQDRLHLDNPGTSLLKMNMDMTVQSIKL